MYYIYYTILCYTCEGLRSSIYLTPKIRTFEKKRRWCAALPFSETAVPFRGQNRLRLSGLSPKWDCSPTPNRPRRVKASPVSTVGTPRVRRMTVRIGWCKCCGFIGRVMILRNDLYRRATDQSRRISAVPWVPHAPYPHVLVDVEVMHGFVLGAFPRVVEVLCV